ncbi:MAG: hypothetical protein ACREMA_00435 [Longimicrobiales bacterium]
MTGESNHHAAYGLILETDAPVFGFGPAPDRKAADVRFWLDSQPDWAATAAMLPRRQGLWSRATDANSRLGRKVYALGNEEFFHIVYPDQTEFMVSADGRRVHGAWVAPLTLADTLTYALGPITSICLRRMGRACLHSSAVAWDQGAVLFVGCAGSGKSTTAAALVQRGAAAVTDDVAAIDLLGETPAIHPGHAWYRLWPDSVRLLCGSETALPLLTPNWDKRYLDADHLAVRNAGPLPIVSVYFLEDGLHTRSGSLITRLLPRDAFLRFLANTLGAPFVDAAGRAHEFRVLSRLAQTVPCSALDTCHSTLPLNGLLDAIEHDVMCPVSS